MIKDNFAPFIHTNKTVPVIYLNLTVALLPCAALAVYNYGLRALILIMGSVLVSCFIDVLCGKLRKREGYFDISSITNGLIYALLLPPGTPVFEALIGILIGVLVFKQFFGGLGANIIEPAVAGRLVIEFIWQGQSGLFATPGKDFFALPYVFAEAASGDALGYPVMESYYMLEVLAGKVPIFMGTGCAVLIIAGGIYLAVKGFSGVVTPIAFILTSGIGMSIIWTVNGSLRNFVVYMLASGVLFTGVFLMRNPSTVSANSKGALISGIIAGVVHIVAYMAGSPVAALLLPAVAVNLLAQPFDYFFRRNLAAGEEALS